MGSIIYICMGCDHEYDELSDLIEFSGMVFPKEITDAMITTESDLNKDDMIKIYTLVGKSRFGVDGPTVSSNLQKLQREMREEYESSKSSGCYRAEYTYCEEMEACVALDGDPADWDQWEISETSIRFKDGIAYDSEDTDEVLDELSHLQRRLYSMSRLELIDLIGSYNDYLFVDHVNALEQMDWAPVCVGEFIDCEFLPSLSPAVKTKYLLLERFKDCDEDQIGSSYSLARLQSHAKKTCEKACHELGLDPKTENIYRDKTEYGASIYVGDRHEYTWRIAEILVDGGKNK